MAGGGIASHPLVAVLLAVALVAVVIGSYFIAPGVGILLSICTVPLFVRLFDQRETDASAGTNVSAGRAASCYGSKIAAVMLGALGSLFLVIAMIPILVIASLVSFFSICFGKDPEATYNAIVWKAAWHLGVPAAIILVLVILAVRSR